MAVASGPYPKRQLIGSQHNFTPPPPKSSRAPWTHLGHSWGRFSVRFQGPAGGIGQHGTKQGPDRRTDQGPAGRIRAPKDVPGLRRTNQDPMGRTSAVQEESGASHDGHSIFLGEFGPLPKNNGAKSKQVLVLGVPWAWAHSPGWPHRKGNPAAAPPPPPSTYSSRPYEWDER